MTPYLTLHSPSFTWLSSLCLQDTKFVYVDLMKLGSMQNLAYLNIVSTTRVANAALDDSVLRGWSRLVTTQNAFPRLKMLFLYNVPFITVACVEYITVFPVLVGFSFYICGRISGDRGAAAKRAKECGWRLSE